MKWTKEQVDLGVKLTNSMSLSDAYKKFNKVYPISEKAFRSKMFKEFRYIRYQQGEKITTTRKDAWTKEEMDYLIELMVKYTRKQAVEQFQKRYGRSYGGINTKAKELKLKCNAEALKTQQRNNEKLKETQFKKGDVPLNHCEVGAIRIRRNGHNQDYYWVKATETGDSVKDWKLAQRYFYEKYHNCEIPKGHKVVFKNGDISNFAKENLILVNNQEFGYWFKYLDGSTEKATTGLIIAKIKATMKRLEKEKNDKS